MQWMLTRFNRRMLFDAIPSPVAKIRDDAWIPGRWPLGRGKRTMMAPLDHYSQAKQGRVQHAVTLHRCPEFRRLNAEVDRYISAEAARR